MRRLHRGAPEILARRLAIRAGRAEPRFGRFLKLAEAEEGVEKPSGNSRRPA